MSALAIDPGPFESAYVVVNDDLQPVMHGKLGNTELLAIIHADDWGLDNWAPNRAVIEMVASYGMAVGAEVFETCVWIGRFYQALADAHPLQPELVKRGPVKLHHCGSTAAKDSNIRQALVDRFAPGLPNNGKGTKTWPGWFHGFRSDIWQAYALAVYAIDTA